MSEAYIKRLVEISDKLRAMADAFFEVKNGAPNISQQRSDAEMMFLSRIHYLCGYIDSIRAEEKKQK